MSTTDIVERLRKALILTPLEIDEVADEIERLRERVHYAEGTAEANIARANEAEARAEKAEAALGILHEVFDLD